MTSSLDEKKDLASQWFRSLRDQFCAAFEELDGGKFERKKWNHKGSGGGEISILKGEVFEKVGVNISTCLLYTSPSPRDSNLSRMPSSA